MTSTPDDLHAVLTDAVGCPLDELDAATAIDVADRLRILVAALPPSTPAEVHYANQLTDAAEHIERAAGIT